MFRNESQDVVRKFKAREAKVRQGSAKSSTAASPVPHSVESFEPGPENFFEVVRREDHDFPTFLPPTFSMLPTVEECATGFFFSNYVIGVHGPTRGHLDHIEDVYNTHDMDENLVASMKSVGLAGYSHIAHAPYLMKKARQEYVKALQLTNKALKSPTDVKKDSTLLSIMVLGIYEMVTGCNQRSMKAWAEHINGSAALVKLRGLEQFKSPAGRRMFIQVTSGILISCIQRSLPIPEHIIEFRAEISNYNISEPGWYVQENMIAFANFRSKTRSREITNPHIILSKALEIDGKFMELFSDIPLDWEYETIFTDADPDVVFNGFYHVYYDYWIAQLWNAMRSCRILLNEQIRGILLQGLSSKPPLFLDPEYTAQLQISTDVLIQLQAGILASVPQHLGYVSRRNSPSSVSNTNVPEKAGQTAFKSPWDGFKNSPFLVSDNKLYDSPKTPIIRSSGGYFLLWPLYLAGCMDITTEQTRRWVVRTLQYIGRSMGIQHAIVAAKFVEKQEEIKVWREKQVGISPMDLSSDPD